MTKKKMASKVFGVALVLATVTACTTVPEDMHSGSVPDREDRNFGVLVLSDLADNEETAAYVTGVSQAAGTQKIIPDVPDAVRTVILADPRNLEWVVGLMDVAGDMINFDTLILAIPRHDVQVTTILGIFNRTQEVIATEAFTVDLEKEELMSYIQDHSSYNEKAGLGSITNAANAATNELLQEME
ncbi:MAG: hypothetical protein PF508_06775 [Spirochaeta sp.]|jgi:hypothetical protein|nr:hypothetical protein [Spirochaeta sp.]